MDISNLKQLTNSSWEQYNNIILSSMDDHHQVAPTFDHPQWPNNYYNLPITNNDSSNSPSAQQNDLLQVQPHNLTAAADQDQEEPDEELGAMKEMMFKIAAMQPVDIDPTTIRKPRRRNVRISDDPQSVAARHRRERISEKIRILQRLVPGGTKMDTASMLDEAIRYVKFLKRQIRILQGNHHHHQPPCLGIPSTSAAAGTTPPGYLFGGNNNDIGAGDHEQHPMFELLIMRIDRS